MIQKPEFQPGPGFVEGVNATSVDPRIRMGNFRLDGHVVKFISVRATGLYRARMDVTCGCLYTFQSGS